ncbi:small mechanosensitive channel family [Plasmopara halstedii]|uniref:Small mechanosensitive channel family n=1 Tax=Plasmopara halstedii TaxID=4781 RepID=A0A0N7L4M9_PLAHL|nr:small mechanosensitive channel family [Plasmopara halstedii]CEG39123.1 small mechanosensitive channel family [Plasmopara halstedii]|eukprot:XP_024575492.1 small mechanosensitive channel family [Plasmopara halstedii]
MISFISWRVGLAILATLAAFFLSRPVIELLLYIIRARLDQRVQWIADVQHYMLTYLWWFLFLILVRDVVVRHILDLGDEEDEILQYSMYIVAVPLVLGTFAMRKVVTNLFVRYFKLDPFSSDYDARIFVITESIKFVYFVFILIEVFYIFFLSNSLMRFVLVAGLLSVELVVIFSGFTILKNVATGLFLIFAEPFRTGSEVKVRRMLGFIERVSLARTLMRREDGSRIYVPNGIFADNYQTSGNAQDAHTHSLMLHLHPSTSSQKMKDFVQELNVVLQPYALSAEALSDIRRNRRQAFEHISSNASRLESDDSVLGYRHQTTELGDGNTSTPRTVGRSSAISSVFDRTGRPIVPPTPPVQVDIYAMFKVKVLVFLDRNSYKLLETAKTEVNLAIIDTIQRLNLNAQQIAH